MNTNPKDNSRKLSPTVRTLLAYAAEKLHPGTPEQFRAACDAEAARIDAERDQK